MQVKTSSTGSVLDSVTASEAFRPPRLNFAQVCRYCTERGCTSKPCIDLHARSLWAVCEECDGFASLALCNNCVEGVVEYLPGPDFAEIVSRPLPATLPDDERPTTYVAPNHVPALAVVR